MLVAVKPAGSVSVTTTAAASDGPAFATVTTVGQRSGPGTLGSGVAVFTMDKIRRGRDHGRVAVAVLLAVIDLVGRVDRRGVRSRVPAAVSLATRATTVIVRVASTASVPNWHTAPPHTPPSEAEAEAKVKPAGSWSFTSTDRAEPGPVLVMTDRVGHVLAGDHRGRAADLADRQIRRADDARVGRGAVVGPRSRRACSTR